jgi:hypothetical protein
MFGNNIAKTTIKDPDLFDNEEYIEQLYHYIIENFDKLNISNELLDGLLKN